MIRPAMATDHDRLLAISLITGDGGADAGPLHALPELIGLIYSVPYQVLRPALSFVWDDGDGAVGFVVGCTDSLAFEAEMEREWWPDLRARYDATAPGLTAADRSRIARFHQPRPTPAAIAQSHPAHMHMNIDPAGHRRGIGRALYTHWTAAARAQGVTGLHVGVDLRNDEGTAFWQAMGFEDLPTSPEGSRYLGQVL